MPRAIQEAVCEYPELVDEDSDAESDSALQGRDPLPYIVGKSHKELQLI